MANGHGGDRRSGDTTAAINEIKGLSNVELLSRLHGAERDRIIGSSEAGSTRLVTDDWPPHYRSLVALAQKRGLCL